MSVEWGVKKYGSNLFLGGLCAPVCSPDTRVFLDVETTGLDTAASIIGIGVSTNGRDIFYYSSFDKIRPLIESAQLVGHNIKFDFKALLANGFNVKPEQIAGDTMLMSYCDNPSRKTHGLKPLAKDLLQMEWPSYDDLTLRTVEKPCRKTKLHPDGTKLVKEQLTLDQLDQEIVAEYNAMDVLACSRLYDKFMENENVWYRDIELPLLRLLIKMELQGMDVNVSYFKELSDKFEKELGEIRKQLLIAARPYMFHLQQIPEHKITDPHHITALKAWKLGDFNPGSSQQKLTLLQFMGLKIDSTDKKILVKHKSVPFVQLLLEYSEVASILNKFLERLVNTQGKVSTTYNQVRSTENIYDDNELVGILTGRLSSNSKASPTDLNLQQMPSRSEKGKQIRNGFIAPEGHVFAAFDYSMIELRIIAHYSQEPTFVEAFSKGLDLHQMVADQLGVTRYAAKQANFLVAYGGGPRKLAETLNLPLRKASEFFNAYWSKYWKIQTWKDSAIVAAKAKGGVITNKMRFIGLPNLRAADMMSYRRAERQAVSCLVQGSAAEVMKIAMLKCYAAGYMPRLTVHDELGFYVANDSNLTYTISNIKSIMENAVKFSVPLVVEGGFNKSWGEAKK